MTNDERRRYTPNFPNAARPAIPASSHSAHDRRAPVRSDFSVNHVSVPGFREGSSLQAEETRPWRDLIGSHKCCVGGRHPVGPRLPVRIRAQCCARLQSVCIREQRPAQDELVGRQFG